MAGIVSLLDTKTTRKVRELRQRLDDEVDVQIPIRNHYPHFSYQVAEQYDTERLSAVLQELAKTQESFTIRTNGIGVFTDSTPLIVYIPVIRTTHLSDFHSRVWDAGKSAGTDLQDYYRPDRWTPHITITPVERDELPSVMQLLSDYAFDWDVGVDNIAAIHGEAPNRQVTHRTPLSDVSSFQER